MDQHAEPRCLVSRRLVERAIEALIALLDELGDPDAEPSLGSTRAEDQRQWAQGDRLDLEEQHDAEADLDHDCTWQDEGDQTRLIGQFGVLVAEGPTPPPRG